MSCNLRRLTHWGMPLIEPSLPVPPAAGSTGSQNLEFVSTAGRVVLHPKVARWTAFIVGATSTMMQKR